MKFVFDLDGTICFKGEPVSENIIRILEALTSSGHEVIFASARPIRDMLPVINERLHHYTMIGGNGSLIAKNGKIIHASTFPAEDLTAIKDLITKFDMTYLIDGDWDYAYTGADDHPILKNVDPGKNARKVGLETLQDIVKILLLSAADMGIVEEKLAYLNVFVNKHRNENVLDISPAGIHKWQALQTLGVEKGDYIAFGNDANDMTMFQNAAHAVMIGHHEELIQYATEVIPFNESVEQAIIENLTKHT